MQTSSRAGRGVPRGSTRGPSPGSIAKEELLRLTVEVVRASLRFNLKVAGILGLPVSDLNALNTLIRQGPLSVSALARELGLSAAATSRLIDRLVGEALVKREAGRVDRRQVTIRLAPAALDRIGPLFEDIAKASREQVEALSEEELAFLIRWQTDSLEITRRAEAGLEAASGKRGG